MAINLRASLSQDIRIVELYNYLTIFCILCLLSPSSAEEM